MAKAKVLASTDISTASDLSDITQKLAVDCQLVSMAINPLFCAFIGMTPSGEIIFIHQNGEIFTKELLLALCEALESEDIPDQTKELVKKVKELLSSEKKYAQQETHSNTS